ncbi:hypothetical protein CYMTET_15982 [Cymbomonas tetramitiformis]|uniref:Inositol polyphosphate-related phosphatase domain-containing protein n=1 Tax=Cymbomonas tetramitiformis TaxID=36881 RepID=A0AAE0GDH6_9CHLO|nr:hypothetical protein CYMTET_15982 [Cymbomonas tetramitiformis]
MSWLSDKLRRNRSDSAASTTSTISNASASTEQDAGKKIQHKTSIASILGAYSAVEYCPRFDVSKHIKKWGQHRVQLRTWEVDVTSGALRNLSRSGALQKQFSVLDLVHIEKAPNDKVSLTMLFESANHPYTLQFEDNSAGTATLHRERFYQLLYLLRFKAKISMVPRFAAEYSDALNVGMENIDVFIGTWNLGNATPPESDLLEDWIPKTGYDLLAIGTQECIYEPREGFDNCEEDWIRTLQSHMGDDYEHVITRSLQAIRLTVFVHKRHLFKVSAVESEVLGTGLGNYYGNKGGVGVSLNFHTTPLTFNSVHLAARKDNVKERNVDAAAIVDRLRVGCLDEVDSCTSAPYYFFFGDLNYRVWLEYEKTVALSKAKQLDPLLAADQLRAEQEAGRALTEFEEGLITFRPTYRYDIGTREFSNHKMQSPSFTDRILWCSSSKEMIQQTSYEACDTITTSDHNPIKATFKIAVHLPSVMFLKNPGYGVSGKCNVELSKVTAFNLRLHTLALDASVEERQVASRALASGAKVFLKFHSPLGFLGPSTSECTEATGLSEHSGVHFSGYEMTAEWEEDQINQIQPILASYDSLHQIPLIVSLYEQNGLPRECSILVTTAEMDVFAAAAAAHSPPQIGSECRGLFNGCAEDHGGHTGAVNERSGLSAGPVACSLKLPVKLREYGARPCCPIPDGASTALLFEGIHCDELLNMEHGLLKAASSDGVPEYAGRWSSGESATGLTPERAATVCSNEDSRLLKNGPEETAAVLVMALPLSHGLCPGLDSPLAKVGCCV